MPSLLRRVLKLNGLAVFVSVVFFWTTLAAQVDRTQSPAQTTAPRVERIGPNLMRLGQVRVDTQAREVSVSGHINDVTLLEWLANTVGGFKEYESAISADTDAVTFNTALLLIGLDRSHAPAPTDRFDQFMPSGDPVELWVEWNERSQRKRVRAEQLILDKRTQTTFPEGVWVYTGSNFLPSAGYMAALDGVLIGFVHSPAPIIENPSPSAVGAYGSVVLNKELIAPGTPVTLIVRALPLSHR